MQTGILQEDRYFIRLGEKWHWRKKNVRLLFLYDPTQHISRKCCNREIRAIRTKENLFVGQGSFIQK